MPAIISRVIIVRGGFVRTVYLHNDCNNHNHHHLAGSVTHQALCQDFDLFQFSQKPCTDSRFVDGQNKTEESNS